MSEVDPGRGVRGGVRRGVARRRRDAGQPDGADPVAGRALARLTFAPGLLLTDGEAYLVDAEGGIEGWLPYAKVFTMWPRAGGT